MEVLVINESSEHYGKKGIVLGSTGKDAEVRFGGTITILKSEEFQVQK